jgi:short-subunit dehydrogenase
MAPRFDDRTVVITGASAGIGAACARCFAAAGASLVLAARGLERLEALAAELAAAGAEVTAVQTDVADPASAAALIERAAARRGRIDVLVNNAGTNRRGAFHRHSAAELAEMVDVNLRAPVMLTRLALPHLRRAPAPAVINVASLAGRVPLPDDAVYSATKFGLRALSFALRDELAPLGIKVAVVSPGPVDTGSLTEELADVPDLSLSQPISTAARIAELVVASAADGQRERVPFRLGGYLTTLGYLFPALGRALTPMMAARGRRQRARLLARDRGAR